jgi:RecA-family ATPase
LAIDFKPPRWAVPGLLPEGLTIIAGNPKAGKSWLVLDFCVAVASGGNALGNIACEPGDVLYLALGTPSSGSPAA